jgi:tetratricopeptide (TPR) repeat protein
VFTLILFSFTANSQISIGNMKDKLKTKATDKVTSIKNKTTEGIDKKLEKSKSEFDASNFNYAISFSDNSGLFETDEKGNRAGSSLKNTKDFLLEKEITSYDRGYGYNSKGEIFFASNKFGSARSMFKLSEFFYKDADSANTLAYAQLMNNQALLFQSTSRYTKALEAIDRAIAIREEKIPSSAMHGVSVNNKAVLLKDMGRYADAEKWIDDAITINKNAGGEKSLGYALALNNKAMLYQTTGRLEKAEQLMKQSVELAKEILSEKSSNYLKLTINLAAIYRDMKKYDDAEKIYLTAIEIKQKKLGTGHPDYAHLKRGLADLYWEMGKTELVEKNLSSALDIYSRKFGDKNAATTSTKAQLANFYRITGKKEKALEMMMALIPIDKELYGENHPEYIKQLENLALAQWVNNKKTDAATNYKIVIEKTSQYIDDYFSTLSESEKTKFWDKTSPRFNRFNSLVVDAYKEDNSLLAAMFNNQLHNKALLLNSSSKVRNQILASDDNELITDYNNWLITKEELGRIYSMTKEQLAEESINIDSLETESNKLEKKLSQKSALFKEGNVAERVTYDKIAAKLTTDEAAVEIIQIQKFENVFTDATLYAVLVLTNASQPELVLIENGKEIENTIIPEYRKATMDLKPENTAYKAVWEPIDKKIIGKKKIYVSLDGIYNQISLLTLKDETTNKYLIDKENIVIVGNTKDILKLKSTTATTRLKTAYLLGYPNYGGNDLIAALPGTKTEVENIRGVNCDYAIQKLLDKGLIEILGKAETIGRPILYGTSAKFMEYFGINDIAELPTPKDFTNEVNTIGEIPEN